MINKIIKTLIIFQIIIIPIEAMAVMSLDGDKNFYIYTKNVDKDITNNNPQFLDSFSSEDPGIIEIHGNDGGEITVDKVSAYIQTLSPSLSKKGGGKTLFPLEGTTEYAFSIEVTPLYQYYGIPSSFDKSYINESGKLIYGPNSNSPEGTTFKAKYIGAKIKIYIYSLEKPIFGITDIPEQIIAKLNVRANNNNEIKSKIVDIKITGFNITPSSKTCKITSNDPHQINMSEVKISDFNTTNEVYGGNTTISLTCNAGITTVKAGMSDIITPNNTSNELDLDPNSTAIGFGVRLYHDNTKLIKYNNNNEDDTWTLNSENNTFTGDTTYTIPIIAKYYRSKKFIEPGTIFAKAKITFIYN